MHPSAGGAVIRAWRPGATKMWLIEEGGAQTPMEMLHDAGVFEAVLEDEIGAYRLQSEVGDETFVYDDPYRFPPTVGDLDLHLMGEGRHERLWTEMGAQVRKHEGVDGVSFVVWAPNARSVRIVGDFNRWDGRVHPMSSMGPSGLWEIFIPEAGPGARYKFEILNSHGHLTLKADPYAFATEVPPKTASVVTVSEYEWGDAEWMEARASRDHVRTPMSVYECHLGSWRRGEGDRFLSYRELAEVLPDHIADLGFTHVEFLPVSEHPFAGSWGYQVSAYYAPTARFGTPDDFRYLVDTLHRRGIGVIVDWVPAHFPRDAFALARFDGTALYEHADPRKGEHPDWGTLIFNYGRNEVRNFLLANALYWLEEFHIDGLRVDAVASMLYLDYSRKEGEWDPNRFGGRENLEAISFIKELNVLVHGRYPGAVTIAEESTSWPGVSRPTYLGGLGFTFKWNLGWMHDTLGYFHHDPIHRRYHHNQLTFGLLYAFGENFTLPLSHDEVVHGKSSLMGRMPGDRWQQFSNLRSLLAWMWAHPGKQLLFMGGEIAQTQEWSHNRSLDWHLLDSEEHRGVRDLVAALNRAYLDEPALWERDFEAEGFSWIDASDPDNNVITFVRFSSDGRRRLACLANLSALPRHDYRVGLPAPGRWREVLNTDDLSYGGSGVRSGQEFFTEDVPFHGFDHSLELSLPPLGVVWLANAP